MANLKPIDSARNLINSLECTFNEMVKGYTDVKGIFIREAEFALQVLRDNPYTLKAATANPESLQRAILNVAATSLSLDPMKKQAYLVPRGGKICLDISYRGMVDVAIGSGSVKWVDAQLVYENDSYEYNGQGVMPTHKFDPFSKERGKWTGVWCVAKTADNDYLISQMPEDEVMNIAKRSQAFKAGSGPWKTDFNEMVKKTVIKRGSKIWPRSDKRLDTAIEVVNEHEGIEFKPEINPPEDNQLEDIARLLALTPERENVNKEEAFMAHLSRTFKRDVGETSELTKEEARQVIAQLKQWTKQP